MVVNMHTLKISGIKTQYYMTKVLILQSQVCLPIWKEEELVKKIVGKNLLLD